MALVSLVGTLVAIGPVAARGQVLAAPVVATSAATATTYFNNPNGLKGVQLEIEEWEDSTIQAAGVGSTVQLAVYRLTDRYFAASLVSEALYAGLHVQVIVDGSERTFGCHGKPGCVNPVFAELEHLNHFHAIDPQTWFETCNGIGPGHPRPIPGGRNGCIGQHLNHNKFILLSGFGVQSPAPNTHTVFQTSSNNTNLGERRDFNNALLLNNQPRLYDTYELYFNQLAASYRSTAPTSTYRFNSATGDSRDTTTVGTHDIATWTFPRAADADPVPGLLHQVVTANRCANPVAFPTDPTRTNVDVAMYAISGRVDVVEALGALSRAGCKVSVIYAKISPADRRILSDAGVALQQLCTTPAGHKHPEFVHSKYFLIDGSAAGLGQNLRIVYTGSNNWTQQGLTGADDQLMRYVEPARSSPVYDSYAQNFQNMLSYAASARQAGRHCQAADSLA